MTSASVEGHAAWMEAILPDDLTIPAQYWNDSEHWMFDPWASAEGAHNIHEHCHTRWARAAFDVWQAKLLQSPAEFDWAGETVYIVGRGVSLEESAPPLSHRLGRAIFLNSSILVPGVEVFPGDFFMGYEAAIANNPAMRRAVRGMDLIAAPQIGPEVLNWDWGRVFGFVNWNSAPLNDYMQHLFPHLPRLVECLGISTAALHLAAKSGAKKIVLVAQDCTHQKGDKEGNAEISVSLPNGKKSFADLYYAQLAMANSILAYFAFKRTGVQIVNCSRDHLIGHDLLASGDVATPLPWMTCDHLENHLGG